MCIWARKRSADYKSFVHHRCLISALIQVCSRLKKIVDNDYLWARASLDSTWVSAENWRIFQRCFTTSIIAFFVHNMRLFASSFAGLQTVGMWKLSPSWPLPTSTLREASLSYGCYSSERVQGECKLDRWVWSMQSDFWYWCTSWTETGAPVPEFWPCAPLWDVNLHNCMWGSLEQHGKCEVNLLVHRTKSAHQCLKFDHMHFHVTSHVNTLLSVLFRLVMGSFMLFVLYPTHSSRGEWQGNACCSEWSKGDRVPAPGRETHPSLPAVLLGALPPTLGSQPPLLQSLCVQSDEASL